MSGLMALGSAIEGSVQLNNTAIQGYQQRKNLERQNKYNREMAEYTYNKDLEMWNRGNAYNSPQAQMERLKAAGLNPNLVYGNGTVAGQSAGAIPKYQTPQANFNVDPMVTMPTNVLGNFMDLAMKQAQIDNVRSQNEGIESDNIIKKVNAWIAETFGRQTAHAKTMAAGSQSSLLNTQAQMKEMERKQYERQLVQARTSDDLKNESQELDNIYKTFKNDFMRMGITDSDNIVFRMIARMIQNTGIWKGWGTGVPNLEMIK